MGRVVAWRLRAGRCCCITPSCWSAFALRGRPLRAAQSSPASATRDRVEASRFLAGARCGITVACWVALRHHACRLARIRLTRTAAERGPVLSGACRPDGGVPQSLASKCLPCSSPHSEHGILGKRRVKLRGPAVGRASRGCQPDEQIRPRLSGTLWSAAVRVRGSRAQRRGRGTSQLTSPHACVLARIRLTRTAAECGPVLSGACDQMGVFRRTWCSRCW